MSAMSRPSRARELKLAALGNPDERKRVAPLAGA